MAVDEDADKTPVDSTDALEFRLRKVEDAVRDTNTAVHNTKTAIEQHAADDRLAIQGLQDSFGELRTSVDTMKDTLVKNLMDALTLRHNTEVAVAAKQEEAEIAVQAERAKSVVEDEKDLKLKKRSFWFTILRGLGSGLIGFMLALAGVAVKGC